MTGCSCPRPRVAITHVRRHDKAQTIVVNLVLLALAAVVAGGRLGPRSFTG
jgi:hypothetical protein